MSKKFFIGKTDSVELLTIRFIQQGWPSSESKKNKEVEFSTQECLNSNIRKINETCLLNFKNLSSTYSGTNSRLFTHGDQRSSHFCRNFSLRVWSSNQSPLNSSESLVSPFGCWLSSWSWLDKLEDYLSSGMKIFDHPIKANQLGPDWLKSYLLPGYLS